MKPLTVHRSSGETQGKTDRAVTEALRKHEQTMVALAAQIAEVHAAIPPPVKAGPSLAVTTAAASTYNPAPPVVQDTWQLGTSAMGKTLSGQSLTPPQLTGSADNYNPGGMHRFVRLSSTGAVNITGLVAGIDGQEHTIVNTGGSAITLPHLSGSSAAPNQFLNSTGASIVLNANQAADIIYDVNANSGNGAWLVFKRT